MPTLKFTLTIITTAASMSIHADDYFYTRFPSCKVFLERNCNEVYETVGNRMYCYRSFLERKKKCIEKTTRLFKEMEASNKHFEAKKKAEVKQIAVKNIDKNFQQNTNKQVEEQDLRTVDKFEGSEVLRNFLSYINRVLVPATKAASVNFDSLLKEAQELMILRSKADPTYNTELASFLEKHKQLSTKVSTITKNYQTYFDFYNPKIQGLRFDENIQNLSNTFEATRFLIINAFEIENSLPDMLAPFVQKTLSDKIDKQKVRTATKSEIIIQKIYQAREKLRISDTEELRRDLDFLIKICISEFPQNSSICTETGAQK